MSGPVSTIDASPAVADSIHLLGTPGRPVRPGPLHAAAHPRQGAVLAAAPGPAVTAEAPSPEAASARVRIDRQHPKMYKRKIEVARAVRAAVDGPDVQPVRDSEEKE